MRYSLQNENWKKAKAYFNLKPGYVLHHKNPEWITTDYERYIQWNPEDLVVMTRAEHLKLHRLGTKQNDEWIEHRMESQKKKCICIETQEIFNGVIEAKKKYSGDIYSCLEGKQKTAGGYHWKFI